MNDIGEPYMEIQGTLHAVRAREACLDDVLIGGMHEPVKVTPKDRNVIHVVHGERGFICQPQNTSTGQLSVSRIKMIGQSGTRLDAFLERENGAVNGLNSETIQKCGNFS